MANTLTSMRTHDPDGVYWQAGATLDTAATLSLLVAGTIIRPLGLTLGTCTGTALVGKISITNAADVVVFAAGIGYAASSIYIPISAIPQLAGAKVVVNAIAGGATVAMTFTYKYISGTAPTVA